MLLSDAYVIEYWDLAEGEDCVKYPDPMYLIRLGLVWGAMIKGQDFCVLCPLKLKMGQVLFLFFAADLCRSKIRRLKSSVRRVVGK